MFTISGVKMETIPVKVLLGAVLLLVTMGDLRAVAVVSYLVSREIKPCSRFYKASCLIPPPPPHAIILRES